jgi:hypothetical protein
MTKDEKRIYNKGFWTGAVMALIGAIIGITLAHIF